MSGVKHTPGPWITFQPRGDGSVPVRTGGLGLTICYVHDGAICDAIANARLIAAAPDLFEAGMELQAARKAQNADPSAKNALRVRAASDAFDIALSKATAQQEGR